MKKICWILLLLAALQATGYSQDARVNIQMRGVTIESVLTEIEKQTEYRFFYDAVAVKLNDVVNVSWSSKRLNEALSELFAGRGISFRLIDRQIALYAAQTNTTAAQTNTRRTTQRFTISGFMRDSLTTESLISATVYNNISTPLNNRTNLAGTTSNQYGFYSLTLPAGEVEVAYSYVGYNTKVVSFHLRCDTTININLAGVQYLQEVTITADQTSRIQESTQMSSINLPVAQIKSLPAVMGETDVIRALQLLPGIQAGSEGSSGIHVRGGSPDQNLILLDGVPVYNVIHLFNFFSVFNGDAINNIEVFKGGFPARYGGRVSSVIDINMKEGNMQKFKGEGSIGSIASSLTLEGPILKDRTSFIVSGRRSYVDLLLKPLIAIASNQQSWNQKFGLYFYDLTAKINHRFSDKDRIYLSAYMGDDTYYIKIDYKRYFDDDNIIEKTKMNNGLQWGNITTAFRWNHIFTNRLFSNTTLTYSRFRYETNALFDRTHTDTAKELTTREYNEIQNNSGIQDWSGKIAFDYIPSPNHYIRFGANVIYHAFNPSEIIYSNTDVTRNMGAPKRYAYEYNAYVEDDFRITKRLKTNVGLRWTAFSMGDELYSSWQPRISARYLITQEFSFKTSYSRMAQYLHLLSNTGIGLPTDIWIPSTELVRPQTSDQVAVGVAQTFRKEYEISLEGYYKTMDNVLELRDGVSIFSLDEQWEQKVAQGTGLSYGGELFVQKKTGSFTGWAGYTLSWSDRHFEELNDGRRFPYKYDRRHDLSVVLIQSFERLSKNKKNNINISATWIFGSGYWITLPVGKFDARHPIIPATGNNYWNSYFEYGERNGYRTKPYHRLDLSISFIKPKKWGEHRWVLSLYNAYNRKNPFYIDVKEIKAASNTKDYSKYKFEQHSLFPIIPSISHQFMF